MPVKVECPSCGNAFSAWEDLIGSVVECPQCQAQVSVHDPDAPPVESDQILEEAEDDFDLHLAPAEDVVNPRSGESAAPEQPLAPPTDCPNCGEQLPPDGMLCPNCSYSVNLKRVLTSDVEYYEPDTSTGFQRWFQGLLEEGESLDTIRFWARLAGLFVLLLITIVGWPTSAWLTFPILGLYLAFYFYGKYRKSQGDEDWFYRAGAKGSLWFVRITGWRSLEFPFPKLQHYSAQDTDFGDDDLADLQNTGEIKALDLSGCPITDAGLVQLESWTQLQYLVLRDTEVTEEAVRRLQVALRDTMIWS